jgi:hypothetical protein
MPYFVKGKPVTTKVRQLPNKFWRDGLLIDMLHSTVTPGSWLLHCRVSEVPEGFMNYNIQETIKLQAYHERDITGKC